ncbi:MAG: signal transduction histidine kinase [Planctomycetota bacterium]|nr:signal transduction histidine kinase [Planctomycetota bacterium]
MSLTTRLSAFFLAALAMVLVGFSAGLYLLANDHLRRVVDERLDTSLTTLAAAAEIGAEGVEWEPDERELGLGKDPGADAVRWVVLDERGGRLDQSRNLDGRRLSTDLPSGFTTGPWPGRDGRSWRAKARRLAVSLPLAPTVPDSSDPRPSSPRHPELTLVTFAPLGSTEATLRRLAGTLAIFSGTLWLVAAVAGRSLCRRALAPMMAMARSARDADADEPATRLPVPETGDELRDLGDAFNGLLDRLHEAMERQRRFAGDASHQLRTPLAAVLSQVDVTLRRDRPPDEYRRVLALIRDRGDQLRQIVESLLFLARAERDAGLPDLEVVDLAAWVPGQLPRWDSHARAADLRVVSDAGVTPFARIHRVLLAQLLDNLLDNALKYSSPGTPIQIALRREAGFVSLSVQDRGRGISAEDMPHIFQPFYRSPLARLRGESGVGLGLAVARRITLAFGGTLHAESSPGVGSRFVVRLPEVAG